jgi:hypothetical protein
MELDPENQNPLYALSSYRYNSAKYNKGGINNDKEKMTKKEANETGPDQKRSKNEEDRALMADGASNQLVRG